MKSKNINQTLAFVFPGQGSQFVGMLAGLAASHSIIEKTFDEASQVLGYDLWSLCQNGPETQLNQTEFTQPALLTAGVALWRVWLSQKKSMPVCMAGHSLGEYTALVCANALSLSDAVQVVARRGALMQNAVPEGIGLMSALLGLSNHDVENLCQEVRQELGDNIILSPANFNSIGQVVISGEKKAVERAMIVAKERGAKRTIILPVSIPSHCTFMKQAALELAEVLEETPMCLPTITVLHNIDGRKRDTIAEIRKVLVDQLYQPVQWVETVQNMISLGVHIFYECGPSNVLCGLNKRIGANIICESLSREAVLCL